MKKGLFILPVVAFISFWMVFSSCAASKPKQSQSTATRPTTRPATPSIPRPTDPPPTPPITNRPPPSIEFDQTRTLRFINDCNQTIWVGAQGNPLPNNGGWVMLAGDTFDLTVPETFSAGRFWARTGCKLNAEGVFECETGDCKGKGIQCNGIGGEKPATLAEFTLGGATGADFYDLSLVDGFNLGMRIAPFGNFKKVNNDGLGKFNCGIANCPVMNPSLCPKELVLKDDANKVLGILSVCAAVDNARQVKLFPILGTYKRNLVCCDCGCGADCGCDNPSCEFGCSPLSSGPTSKGGKCFVENWPLATNGMRYDKVFKTQCPDAYSWQFDDVNSTYQCQNSDYIITFFDK